MSWRTATQKDKHGKSGVSPSARPESGRLEQTILTDELMEHEDVTRRFTNLAPDAQLRVLAALGHKLTIAARETYEFQAPGVRAPQRLRDINEIQHRIFGHIVALATAEHGRYPDDDLISIVLELGDERVRAQCLWALQDALTHAAS